LEGKGWWSSESESDFKKKTRKEILKAFSEAEKLKKPPVKDMFTDVYDVKPLGLKKQEQELHALMKKYPQFYDASPYSSSSE
jgi:2-oxoisovalerate dehydrogenase E1 component alpha subunit